MYSAYKTMEEPRFVTYVPGNCNILLASPHGGAAVLENAPIRPKMEPKSITKGSGNLRASTKYKVIIFQDIYTRPIAEMIGRRIEDLSGKRPHMLHLNIHRRYVDVNRPRDQGTSGHPLAEEVWDEYHQTLNRIRTTIQQGIFFDIHGQKHPHGLLELGYCVKSKDLNDHNFSASDTSIKNLASRVKVETSLADLIWGAASFGAMLQQAGLNCVPSPLYPTPGVLKYYSGGYSTEQYGSLDGGGMDAIQIEIPKQLRSAENASIAVDALAQTIVEYTNLHY